MSASEHMYAAFSYEQCKLPSASKYIRLVDLNPSPIFLSPLECSITAYTITDVPSYTALSYTWGSDDKTSSILLQPPTEARIFEMKVTPSLEKCLRHLRQASGQHQYKLWIDQICINQSDRSEKRYQIVLMREIYINAQRVVAWLGPAEHGSDELMDKWLETGEDAAALGINHLPTTEVARDLSTQVQNILMKNTGRSGFEEMLIKAQVRFSNCLDDILKFHERLWFRRIWIVQEVALGREVYIQCGSRIVAADILYWGMSICKLSSVHGEMKPGIDRLSSLLKTQNSYEPLTRLMGCRNKAQAYLLGKLPDGEHGMPMCDYLKFLTVSYLTTSPNMEASDPRDKIFGMLALPADAEELQIDPDYTLTMEQVYTKAAKAILKRGNGKKGPTTELLNLCRFPRDEISDNLPSWVPDWRATLKSSFFELNHESTGQQLFTAGGPEGTLPIVVEKEPPDENIISLRGYLVDQIEEVGDSWHGIPQEVEMFNQENLSADDRRAAMVKEFRRHNRITLSFLEEIQILCDKAVERYAEDPSSAEALDNLKQAFWRVPCGDLAAQLSEWPSTRAKADWQEAYEACIENCRFMVNEDVDQLQNFWKPLLESRTQVEKTRLFHLASNYQHKIKNMRGMRPFMTKRGYVGMAPMGAAVGDSVVVFIGAQLPFVIRGVKGGGFTLIGDAYCHLVMDGEICLPGNETDFFLK